MLCFLKKGESVGQPILEELERYHWIDRPDFEKTRNCLENSRFGVLLPIGIPLQMRSIDKAATYDPLSI